jgi:hypothetical protein
MKGIFDQTKHFWKHDIPEIKKGSFQSINYESNQLHLMKAEFG